MRGVVSLAAAGVALAACTQSGPHTRTAKAPPILHIGPVSAVALGSAERVSPAGPIAGRYVLAGSLPAGPTHAAVWRWPHTTASKDDVTKLAVALDIAAAPQRHAFGWLVTSPTGQLRVHDDGGDSWSYVRADLQSCPPYGVDVDSPVSGGFGCATAGAATVTAPQPTEVASPAPPIAPMPPSGPDDATTRATAAKFLTALGLHGDEHVDRGSPASTLTFSPAVGGLPTTGIDTRIDVDSRGIRAATGMLLSPDASDDYPLISARAAFTQLALLPQPMIAMYCGPLPPVGAPAPLGSSPGANAASSPDAVRPAPCPSLAPLRVTGARLGLGLQTSYDADNRPEGGIATLPVGPLPVDLGGAQLLVPEWLFTIADSHESIPVVAVEPRYLGPPDYLGPPTQPAPSAGSGAAPAGSASPAS